jgi:hypothetical protein
MRYCQNLRAIRASGSFMALMPIAEFSGYKRKLQLLPLHFASSSGLKAKAGAFAYFI